MLRDFLLKAQTSFPSGLLNMRIQGSQCRNILLRVPWGSALGWGCSNAGCSRRFWRPQSRRPAEVGGGMRWGLRKLIWKLRRILRTWSSSPALPVPPERSLVASGLRRALRRMRCFQRRDLCKVPMLKARSAQQLSSLRAPRQSERHEEKVRCNHVWKLPPSSFQMGSHLLILGSVCPGPPTSPGSCRQPLPSSGLDTKRPRVPPACVLLCS